jgi:hypothetical protein
MDPIIETAEVCVCVVMGAATVLILVCMYWGLCRLCEEIVLIWKRLDEVYPDRR